MFLRRVSGKVLAIDFQSIFIPQKEKLDAWAKRNLLIVSIRTRAALTNSGRRTYLGVEVSERSYEYKKHANGV